MYKILKNANSLYYKNVCQAIEKQISISWRVETTRGRRTNLLITKKHRKINIHGQMDTHILVVMVSGIHARQMDTHIFVVMVFGVHAGYNFSS